MLLSNLAIRFSTFIASLSVYNSQMERAQDPLSVHNEGTIDEFKAEAGLMLSDILTVQTSASIFFSYARDTRIGELLEKEGAEITILAPTNKAVMALARKPHQGPTPIDDGIVITEKEFDIRSRENVERWITAHIVPDRLGQFTPSRTYETLLDGVTFTVQSKNDESSKGALDWLDAILNGNISIVNKVEAKNGILYLLDGALYG
ncbi:fas1 domain-containing [Pyrrhoderma noxium]|uniref:Fas1 domain-containing n=1 Tax=Pyrrhoderma noxium TaxID=2282107 RepID=A0A286UTN2_9AGAM|nr:fas1 domain-containing [Pyrrhoderma noxium]